MDRFPEGIATQDLKRGPSLHDRRDAFEVAIVNLPIRSGDRRVVILDRGDGRFEPRPVETGRRGTGYLEIRDGLAEGDVVVTSANFLIDAESNLKSALKTMTEPGAPQ